MLKWPQDWNKSRKPHEAENQLFNVANNFPSFATQKQKKSLQKEGKPCPEISRACLSRLLLTKTVQIGQTVKQRLRFGQIGFRNLVFIMNYLGPKR